MLPEVSATFTMALGRKATAIMVITFVLLFTWPRVPAAAALGSVAAIYEPLNALPNYGRGALTPIQVLAPMRVDFVLRGYLKWGHCPDWWPYGYSQLPTWQYGRVLPCNYQGVMQSLNQLSVLIAQLKHDRPNLIFGAAITTAVVDPQDTWPDGTPLSRNDLREMYGYDKKHDTIPFQTGYLMDMNSKTTQRFITGWTEKLIDAGVDSIFFDEIGRYQTLLLTKYGYTNATAMFAQVYASYGGIVNAVKSYAASRGKSILASYNNNADILASASFYQIVSPAVVFANVDFVIASLSIHDFGTATPQPTEDWVSVKNFIRQGVRHDLPIVTFLDWAGTCASCQLYKFAHLSQQQQIHFLQAVQANTKANGVLFAFPVWGGDDQLYPDKYDSVRAGTYDTMVTLSSGSIKITSTSTASSAGRGQRNMPGFPIESILIGILLGITTVLAVGVYKMRRQNIFSR